MWILVFLIALLISLSLFFFSSKENRKKFRLGFLSLMLLGATLMIFVDNLIGFLSGEDFFKVEKELILESIFLGIIMLIPILIVWLFATFTSFGRNILKCELC
jgi:formate hydrogenlyase subunit 3/multisubunit Na+/H+ antiporter MnhD subunit